MLDSRVGLSLPTENKCGKSKRNDSVVSEWDCGEWIVYAHQLDDNTILCCNYTGAVMILDRRRSNVGIKSVFASKAEITAVSANERIMAVGTVDRDLSIYQLDNGNLLNHINYSDVLATQKSSPVATVAVHKERALVAVSSSTNAVAVYGLQNR